MIGKMFPPKSVALLIVMVAITRAVGEQRRLTTLEAPPTVSGYALLGHGWCDGDSLYRSMSSMLVTITDGSESLAGKVPSCSELCTNASILMNRCMGFQVSGSGECYLYDRDWTLSDKASAESALGVTMSAKGIQSFPGLHLKRLNDDPYLLSTSSSKGIACYRRQITCSSAPNCAALNRYECDYGKTANTCDLCLPRYTDSTNPTSGNTACSKTNNAVPTLRIGFANGAFVTEDNGDTRGTNQAYLTAAYAIKWAWEQNYQFLPSPLVPLADRQQFNIEFYDYTENLTKASMISIGGTEQVTSQDVTPGLRAIAGTSGGTYASNLQIKEPPANERVHAIIGGLYSSLESEKSLMGMGGQFQTPVLGFSFDDATLKAPYYIRTNRVALNAGSAIAKLLGTIGYDTITVVEQSSSPTVRDQIAAAAPSIAMNVEKSSEDTAGSCGGSKACTDAIIDTWKKVRNDDARIIVHEMGGNSFEFYLLMSTDLLSPKTLYVQVGHACDYVNLMGDLGWAQADYRAIDNANFSQCQVCPNIIQYLGVPDTLKQNWTYVALYLFSDSNPYLAYQTLWCPQFPTVEDLLACDYCKWIACLRPTSVGRCRTSSAK